MRIALVTNRYAPSVGGVQVHVARLARHLAAAGHDVTVLTHRLRDDLPEDEVVDGVRVRRFPLLVRSEHLMTSLALGRHLRDAAGDYDVVHVHGFHDSPAMIAAHVWNGPLVFTPHFHGTSASLARRLLHVPYRYAARRVVQRAATVICVSPSEERAFLRAYPEAEGRTRVISNGVDVDRFRSAVPVRGEDDRSSIVTVGRLEAYKRVDRTIEAMVHLRHTHRLDICGDGPDRGRLEELAALRAVSDVVHFHGTVADDRIAGLVAGADVLVSLSEHEAQGIVLMEALAAGTVALASDIPAHRDVRDLVGAGVRIVAATATRERLAEELRAAAAARRPDAFVPTWSEIALSTALVHERAIGADTSPVGSEPGNVPGRATSGGDGTRCTVEHTDC